MNRHLHRLHQLLTRNGQWQCDVCGGWFGYTCSACQGLR